MVSFVVIISNESSEKQRIATSGLNETSCTNKEKTLAKKCIFVLKLDPNKVIAGLGLINKGL